jgi:hypothetical protein
MKYLGKDPNSTNGDCPAVWDNGDTYIVQGWRVTDAAVLAEVGQMPDHEFVIEIPKRLMVRFPEVTGGGTQ